MIGSLLIIIGGAIFLPANKAYQKHKANKRYEEYYKNLKEFPKRKTMAEILSESMKNYDGDK